MTPYGLVLSTNNCPSLPIGEEALREYYKIKVVTVEY